MQSLNDFAASKLAALETRQLRRRLAETERAPEGAALRAGRRLISFSCNDYLGLSRDPRVLEAANAAAAQYGTGAGASRLVTGNHPLYRALEARLARLKGTDDACVFGSGYLANLGIIPSLVGPDDLILADELSHACLLAGGALASGRLERFRHNDVDHLETLLEEHRADHNRALILTDGVFSMDGDLAPLPELAHLAKRFDAWLMTDDAHGIGVLGGGRGSSFEPGNNAPVPLQMGTLSKAIGSYGGYLCASQSVIDLIRTRARTFIYSTGLPPSVVAASIAALEIIETEPGLVAKPRALARQFTERLGLPDATSSIVPLVLGAPERALRASALLEEAGFLVTAIRPPTVPEGTARLRFAFSATHAPDDVMRLANIVRAEILEA